MIDEKGLTGKAKDIKSFNVLDRVEDDNKDSDESITSVVKRKSSTPKKTNKESIDYCLRDYKNHHSWSRIGIARGNIIYQCSQCRKCAFEQIVIIGNLFPKGVDKNE